MLYLSKLVFGQPGHVLRIVESRRLSIDEFKLEDDEASYSIRDRSILRCIIVFLRYPMRVVRQVLPILHWRSMSLRLTMFALPAFDTFEKCRYWKGLLTQSGFLRSEV